MQLKKNDRVMYRDRLGTVMSDIGYYHINEKNSYIDILLDKEDFICSVRVDYLKKVDMDIPTYDNQTYIELPKVEINPGVDVKKIAKRFAEELKKNKITFESLDKNLVSAEKKPIQLNRKDIDNKCYEIMGEKTLYICLEELAELQQAITKFLRGKPNMGNIEEEIADVEICLEWVKDIIKPNTNHIEAWKDYKYNRMKTRIEKGEMK